MRIGGTLLVVVLAASALSGCVRSKLSHCSQTNEDYAGAREMPPLQAPAGLDAPNTRNALRIPPLNTPERPRGKDEPCLDIPPPFASQKTADPKSTPPTEAPNPR